MPLLYLSPAVLSDVVKTMYSKKFIAELFKPQPLYSNRSTRQIFDRLAHSSIMRLNENSMDKVRGPDVPPHGSVMAWPPV